MYIAVTIAALYLGRELFIPFGLAILLSFMLAPLVDKLRHHHVPRIPAVALTVTLAMGLIGVVAVTISSQVVSLAKNLPAYQSTIQEKNSLPQIKRTRWRDYRPRHGSVSGSGQGIIDH